jgi:hypothetical protein
MVEGGFAFENADQLWAVAQKIAKSKLRPKNLDTPEDCFLVMAYGQMYGFHPMEALQSLFVVHGRVAADGQTMAGLIQSHPLCKSYRVWAEGEGDERAGCVQSWRKGRDAANDVVRFSIKDARQAGLYPGSKDSVWFKYTDDLLIWKAVARDKRRNWADAHRKLDVLEDIQEVREVRNVTPPRAAPTGPDPLLAQLGSGQAQTIEIVTRELEVVDVESEGGGVDGHAGEAGTSATEAPVSATIEQLPAKKRSADAAGVEPGTPSDSPVEIPLGIKAAISTRVARLVDSKRAAGRQAIESMVVDMLLAEIPHEEISKAALEWKPRP